MQETPGKQLIWLDVTVRDVLARYEVGETIGVGGFAVVKKGRDKETGQIVAIKVVDKWRYASEENSEREIRILSKVNHKNCIQMHAVYVTARRVYIVTELVTGGELLDKVTEKGMFSEAEAAWLTKQVLEGVAYLHKKGIVHRDLKLENILLEDSQPKTTIKIADFGLSKVFSSTTTLSTVCGSPLYMAPELLTVEQQGDYSPAVDVWSVGVILFILLAGYSPFDDANDAVLFEKIKTGRYDDGDPVWDRISDGAKDLISNMLDVSVERRLQAHQCLCHPWLVEQAARLDAMSESDIQTLPTAAVPSSRQVKSVSRLISARSVQRSEVQKASAEGDLQSCGAESDQHGHDANAAGPSGKGVVAHGGGGVETGSNVVDSAGLGALAKIRESDGSVEGSAHAQGSNTRPPDTGMDTEGGGDNDDPQGSATDGSDGSPDLASFL